LYNAIIVLGNFSELVSIIGTMKEFSTVVTGVVFPGVENYLGDYVRSLVEQRDQEFDLIIINDGADPELRKLFPARTNWFDLERKLTPGEIRQLVFKRAIEYKYEHLIFTDTDDYFSSNRISESKKNLKEYDFAFNELVLVDRFGTLIRDKYLSSIEISDEITEYGELRDRNFIGLTNSAVNLSALAGIDIPLNIVAIDWWLYSVLLINGCRGKFIRDTSSFYRQHESNTTGLPSELTAESLRRGIDVKERHYSALLSYAEERGLRELSDITRDKLSEMQTLELQIENKTFCEHYINSINDNREFFKGWWSPIVPASKMKAYN
jgi:hypothetical protein